LWGDTMAKLARVTIEDISRSTGLSRGTVSRALNDRPDISEQTKRKVLEACRKLNYSPSHAARSLATGRSFAVAVLIDDLQSVFAAAFLRGALAKARAAHYAVHVAELGPDPEQQQEAIRALVNERIDSVLVATQLSGDALSPLREALEDRPIAACAPLAGIDCDLLMTDQAESGRLVARHLLENGAANLLYVHAPTVQDAVERLSGFQEICRQHGLDPEALTLRLTEPGPLSPEAADRVLARLAEAQGVAATDDFLAVQIMLLCMRLKRAPGRDVAVVGQGNERVGTRVTPTLSTTDFCGEEIGRRAMETVLARLSKARMDAFQTARVAPQLLPRESSRRH